MLSMILRRGMLLFYLVSYNPVLFLQSMLTVLGGRIFVFTGILPVCENEDGLASVLGHGMCRKHYVAFFILIPNIPVNYAEIAHQGTRPTFGRTTMC